MQYARVSGFACVSCTLLFALFGCGQEGVSRGAGELSTVVDTSGGAREATVIVRGLSSDELTALRATEKARSESDWQTLFQVSVADADGSAANDSVGMTSSATATPPMSGKYSVNDSALVFRPRFPLDAGRRYRAALNPHLLSAARANANVVTTFSLPAASRTAQTFVRTVYPSGDTVPENLLRMYIEFSAPMSRTGGLDYISLQDESGKPVAGTFLPLDADFWNAERTRYTAFLDPGRVKRGILPNEQMGRAIRAGHRYTIVVDSTWRDANGLPLVSTYRRSFQVVAPDEQIIQTSAWAVAAPTRDTKGALIVSFPESLDHGLLRRALGVETVDGVAVAGDVTIDDKERRWRFTPHDSWNAGRYRLLVLNILEDPAGNRIDGAFEVDKFDRVDSVRTAERRYLVFEVR